MSIGEKASRLLNLSDSTRSLGLLHEIHKDTTDIGDKVFELIGNSADYGRVAGIINAAADYNSSYAVVLQGLLDEIRVIAFRHLGQ